MEVQWLRSSTLLVADGMRGTLATASSGFSCGTGRLVIPCMAPRNCLSVGWWRGGDGGCLDGEISNPI